MAILPNRREQMLAVHGPFIRQVVEASQITGRGQELEALLASARQSGWQALVGALRSILKGRRDSGVLQGLDEEDRVIAEAVMQGLQNPATLPRFEAKPEPALAAPGLAGMIHAAGSGNAQALQLIADMAQQMSKAGGEMGRLAAVIRPLINGERDAHKLCKGMSAQGEQLVLGILEELRGTDG